MREYGKVYTSFWSSEDMRSLSEDGRMLALYLMSCPHGNMLGCFRLPSAYAAEDLFWSSERVSKGFDELFRIGFCCRCDKTFWIFIRKHLEWNQFENPNVGKAAGKLFDILTAPKFMKALLSLALREFSPTFPVEKLDEFDAQMEAFDNPFETLSKPFEKPIESLSKTVAVAVAGALASAKPNHVAAPSAAPRKTAEQKNESSNKATWEAYSNAYVGRYRAPPVRNAKVNSIIAQLVARLGSEAPDVAAFYVRHNNQYYVRKMHDVGSMLSDAEKLRTEWATGSQMTFNMAAQTDKTQTNLNAFSGLLAEAEERERLNGQ